MTDALAAWPEEIPARLRPAIAACAAGELPPNVALMRLLMDARDAAEGESTLMLALGRAERDDAASGAARRLADAIALLRANPQAEATVKAVLQRVKHDRTANTVVETIARLAAAFDEAARASPEGSVALYSLGSSDLLQAATAEVVERLREWGVLARRRSILEIGCGNGRFGAALAPEAGLVVGIDISPVMTEAARRRCAALANVQVLRTSGRDLAAFADASFDLVLAVDSFPYLVQAGIAVAETHVAESARVLRPGGSLVVLNFSYRGDAQADAADMTRLAARCGFVPRRSATRDFTLWDGLTFHLTKAA